MLHTQKFLNDAKLLGKDPFVALTDELGIKCRHYPEANVVLLSYDQIESPKTHPVVIECRSLILDLTTFDVVSRKFDRFFNIGEAPDTLSDFLLDDSVVYEKADGSLVGFWFCKGTNQFEISTRGMAFAEGEHTFGGTFKDHILLAMGATNEQFQKFMSECVSKDLTIVGEYCAPDNRIVTKYEDSFIVITGISSNGESAISDINHLEAWAALFRDYGFSVRAPKIYPIKESLEALVNDANELKNLEEGFVVCDPISNKRVKIKAASYLLAHRLRGNDPVPTRKNMLELVLTGEVDEFLAYFSEFTDMVRGLQAEVESFLNETEMCYNANKGIESQKDFALAVKDSKGAAYMFSARKLDQDVRTVFNTASLTQKMKTFGV